MMGDEYRGSRIAEEGFHLADSKHGSATSSPEVPPPVLFFQKGPTTRRNQLRNTTSLVQRLLVKHSAREAEDLHSPPRSADFSSIRVFSR